MEGKTFAELQAQLRSIWPTVTLRSIGDVERTVVVVHSISFGVPDQLIPLFPAYEERFLCLVLSLLRAPSVTRILKELEDRKLLVRESDPNDRRRTMVALSPEGREFVKMTSRTMMRILRQYSERFGIERLERLADELRALSAAVKGIE